jgi:hypothetical protein
MPEMPEVQGFVHLIQRGKDFVSQKHYNELKVRYTILPYHFPILTIEQFFVQIIPICFSRGSTKRAYQSFTVHHGDYDIEVSAAIDETANKTPNLKWLRKDWPPRNWRQWAEESWGYLLDSPREAGPILCVSRGKQLVIAAGHVSEVFC